MSPYTLIRLRKLNLGEYDKVLLKYGGEKTLKS